MSTINPSLSAAALSVQSQQANPVIKDELKMTEHSHAQATNGGNSTVTLSDNSDQQANDYQKLVSAQTVRNTTAAENQAAEANQTSSGLTYATALQSQANFHRSNQPLDEIS